MPFLRIFPGVMGVLAVTLACSDREPEPSAPSAPNVSLHAGASIEIDGSYPDEPPYVFLPLLLSDSQQTPTSLSVDRIELFTRDGGQPVATLHGEIDPGSVEFADGTQESTYFQHPIELNSELTGACDAERLVMHLRGSACGCSIVLESDVSVHCVPDARAGDLLADEGEPAAADKPCAIQRFADEAGTELVEEHSLRYDGEGRLRFIDIHDAQGTLTERQAFSYEPSGYLKEELKIDPETTLIFERLTFAYDDDGLLATRQWDGSVERADGIVDWSVEHSFDGPIWTETFTDSDPNVGVETYRYTYDEEALTIDTGDNIVTLAAPLDSPNDVFAVPERVFMAKTVSSGPITVDYDDGGRLMTITYPFYFEEVLDEYVYECE
jgi:hypothetical protein